MKKIKLCKYSSRNIIRIGDFKIIYPYGTKFKRRCVNKKHFFKLRDFKNIKYIDKNCVDKIIELNHYKELKEEILSKDIEKCLEFKIHGEEIDNFLYDLMYKSRVKIVNYLYDRRIEEYYNNVKKYIGSDMKEPKNKCKISI